MQPSRIPGLLACAILLIAGCAANPEVSDVAAKPMTTTDRPATFLALGDSYTIGESVASDERWPAQLSRRLRHSGFQLESPRIIAKTGWTTDELSAAMDDADLHPPYDLVTLGIGVNDQYRGRAADTVAPRFEALLARAIELAGGDAAHVVVLSIPDWGVTPFARKDERGAEAISRQIEAYNAIERDITERHHARWVDVTGISRQVADDILLVANDGLHPSPRQYRRWVNRVLREARDILAGFKGAAPAEG